MKKGSSQKLWRGKLEAVHIDYEVSTTISSGSNQKIGDLPEDFVVTHVYADAEVALDGGGTQVGLVGTANDADRYFDDLESGTKANVIEGVATNLPYKVPAADTEVFLEANTADVTGGSGRITFYGYQG